MTRPDGEPGRREDELLAAEGLKGDSLRVIEHNRLKGGRRALRFRAFDSAVRQDTDLDGPFLEFKFTLQKGCYATCLLREILKNDARIGGEHGGSSSGSGDAEGDDDREEGGDDTDRG
jgi:tRNA(Glu) U13 pseudouridine synthase TruD